MATGTIPATFYGFQLLKFEPLIKDLGIVEMTPADKQNGGLTHRAAAASEPIAGGGRRNLDPDFDLGFASFSSYQILVSFGQPDEFIMITAFIRMQFLRFAPVQAR